MQPPLVPSARRARRIAAVAISSGLLVVALLPVSVSAGGADAVRGIQHEFGSCGQGTGYLMTGDLEGCWWVDTFEVKPMPIQGTMLATGVEHFIGTFKGESGSFTTTYTYTARFDGATELLGRCHHPLTGGTGVFAGATGQLSFKDVADVNPPYYPYWGAIRLASGATTRQSAPLASTDTSGIEPAIHPC